MALTSFRVTNQKSLRLVEATQVPPVMIIAGPNGVGKSTLLYAIKTGSHQATPNTKLLYQGPHRVLRRTQVQRRWLGGGLKWLSDLLGINEVSGYEGLSFQNPSRSPDNVDEAGSTIKHTLGKIENNRQATLAYLLDRLRAQGSTLDTKALPDVYEPLRTLTKYLLPHLLFSGVDFKNEDNIRCLWTRTDANGRLDLDIDDLSSGEKSIVVLFLPLLEEQIRERLKNLEQIGTPAAAPILQDVSRVVLVDEPEIHLHPDLQAKILAYIRDLTRDGRTQFVITTHSPTILDQAFDDELFVLSEPSTNPNENQLRRIATNAERLEALKQLAGSAYFLTTGRAIVCIEGERASETEDATDVRLLEVMYPRATAFTLVPTTGKGNVITTVTRLREHVPEATFRIRVRGLVDADQSTDDMPVGIQSLPVCMIENFLLDAEALHDYLLSLGIATFADPAAVNTELQAIAATLREDEIGLRVQRKLKRAMIRIGGATADQVKTKHAEELKKVAEMLPDDVSLAKLITETAATIDQIIATGQALDRFRGKAILRAFYQRHVAPKNISYAEACIQIAKRVGKAGKVGPRLDPVFDKLVA